MTDTPLPDYEYEEAVEQVRQRIVLPRLDLAPGAPGDPTACTCDPKRWRYVPADRIRHEPTCPRSLRSSSPR